MKNLRLVLYVKADKMNREGEVPVFLKMVYLNSKTSMSLGLWVDKERWKITEQFKYTRTLSEQKIRSNINAILTDVNRIFESLKYKEIPFSAQTIKKEYAENDTDSISNKLMLSELFDRHYEGFLPLVQSQSRAKETLRKYQTLRNHVYDFIELEYNLSDVPLRSLNYAFIESFDLYLRSNKGIGNNTTVKYVQGFRRLMNLAVKYDWLHKDPFLLYDKKIKVKDATFLDEKELKAIEEHRFASKRLDVVRDIFIFGCYTGYAPVDMHKLTQNNLVEGDENQIWIMTKRTKTGINSDVPLLPMAQEIIEKYKNDPYCIETGHLLPKRSTQKMNTYLKEIAEIVGVNKSLHQYVARHTFACTVIMANGLSMEVLSKMLGHTNLKQTMHYGKIQNARVGKEMLELRNKLKG